MAGKFFEPQTPLMQGGDFYYPQTTAGQVILPDGRRLGSSEKLNLTASDVNALSVDTSNGIQGEAALSNADMLGNIPADGYATKDMIPEGMLSLDPDDVATQGEQSTINATLFSGMTYEQVKQDLINEIQQSNEMQQNFVNSMLPVGALYFSYTGDDPNLRWNFTKWERINDAYIHTSTINSSNVLVMNQVPALIWRRTA